MLRDFTITPWMLGGPPEFFPSELDAVEAQSDADAKASQATARSRSRGA